MLIVLIGYRCSGKTSVGKCVASILKWQFMDSDAIIEKRAGKSVEEIVETGGWSAFRKEEEKVIKRLATLNKKVLATGGGAILNPVNRELLIKHGILIWLQADIATIKNRMSQDGKTGSQRPGLTNMGSMDEIEAVLLERTPYYQSAADYIIETSKKSIDEIADEIITLVKQHPGPLTKGNSLSASSSGRTPIGGLDKSEIRSTKSETNTNDQNSKSETT